MARTLGGVTFFLLCLFYPFNVLGTSALPSHLAAHSLFQSTRHFQRGPTYFNSFDGAKIHYDIRGNLHSDKAVILLHGFSTNASYWYQFIRKNQALRREYRIIALTLRGYGLKERYSELGPIQPLEYYDAITEDIRLIMEREAIDSAVLIGHSMGGEITRYFHFKYPEKVKGMALLSSFVEFPINGYRKLRIIGTALKGIAPRMLQWGPLLKGLNWYKDHVARSSLLRAEWFLRWISNNTIFVQIRKDEFTPLLEVALSTTFQAWLHGIAEMGSHTSKGTEEPRPTLILHGVSDRLVVQGEFYRLKELFPHAAFGIVNGRHGIGIEQKDHTIASINALLNRVFVESAL